MANPKARFKKNEKFFHPGQNLFIVIDDMVYMPNKNESGNSGWLYTLKCYRHEHEAQSPKPWKRYYEKRIITELLPMRPTNAVKILYDESELK